MSFADNIALGLSVAFSGTNLLYCFIGVFLGTLFGVIPGIGALSAMSLLFPLTFYLEPTTALIMLAGIWYGTAYGGSTAAILLNLPGSASSAATTFDGYPMSRQGRGGIALMMVTIGSFVGGSVGIILMTVFSPAIAKFALSFQSPEYFAIIVLGLIACSAITEGSATKSFSMIILGLLIGTVGLDMYTAVPRFTFGIVHLDDGFALTALAMGLFGVSEILYSIGRVDIKAVDKSAAKWSAMRPTREDWRRSWGPMFRGSWIGSFFGAMPGTGPSIAAFVSYAVEKRISRHPEQFGKGAIEGVVAPETANNAADQTSFIPTMALGVPGSASMALMLGVLMMHGIMPGPQLITEQPGMFWGLVMSFWIGNVLLVILNLPMIGLWVRMLLVPYHILYPIVLIFICIGMFTVNNNVFDLWIVAGFGILGYVMKLTDFPAPPLLVGFVLGPLLEEHFRRSMLLARGNPEIFINRPISATIMALSLLLFVWSVYASVRHSRKSRMSQQEAALEQG